MTEGPPPSFWPVGGKAEGETLGVGVLLPAAPAPAPAVGVAVPAPAAGVWVRVGVWPGANVGAAVGVGDGGSVGPVVGPCVGVSVGVATRPQVAAPSAWKPSNKEDSASWRVSVPVPLKTTMLLPGGFGLLSSRSICSVLPLSLPTTCRFSCVRTPPEGALYDESSGVAFAGVSGEIGNVCVPL